MEEPTAQTEIQKEVVQSISGTINAVEKKKIIHNIIIFLVPLGLVVIPSLIINLPAGWSEAPIALYILNVIFDILKNYHQGIVQ